MSLLFRANDADLRPGNFRKVRPCASHELFLRHLGGAFTPLHSRRPGNVLLGLPECLCLRVYYLFAKVGMNGGDKSSGGAVFLYPAVQRGGLSSSGVRAARGEACRALSIGHDVCDVLSPIFLLPTGRQAYPGQFCHVFQCNFRLAKRYAKRSIRSSRPYLQVQFCPGRQRRGKRRL